MKVQTWLCLALLLVITLTYNACDPLKKDLPSKDATVGGNPIEIQGRISPYAVARKHIGCFTRYSYYDLDGAFYEQRLTQPKVIYFDPNGTDLGDLIVPDKTVFNFMLIFEPGCNSPDIPPHISLIIKKATEDIYNPHYTQFKFSGYYNKITMNRADITFNFQNFIEYFERLQTADEIPFAYVGGTFGPTTIARIAPHSFPDTHKGCLIKIGVVRMAGNYEMPILPRVVNFESESQIAELGLVPGQYERIFLVFSKLACGSSELPPGVSYQVSNQHGTFNKSDAANEFTLSFASEMPSGFNVPEDRDKGIDFDISTLFQRLADVRNQSEFEQAFPTINDLVGTFKPGN